MIILLFGIIFCICLILTGFNVDSYFVSSLFSFLSTIALSFIIFAKKEYRSIKIVIFLSLVLRIILLIIDLHFFRLPHAGADDDYFFSTALMISDDYTLLFTNTYGGLYSKFLSIIFIFLGNSRLGVQFLNVVLSILFLIIMNDNLKLLNICEKSRLKVIALLSFLPNGLFLGSILRREVLISLLLSLSIKYVIKWYNTRRGKYSLIGFSFSFLAALFHSAMLVVPVMILIYYFLFNFNSNRISFKGINFIKSFILIIIIGLFLVFFINNFQNKFTKFDSIDEVYSGVTNTRGGSAYLTNLTINNLYQLVLYTPIKTFYFLFSPMIWSVRGLTDFITVLFDSFVYLTLILLILKSNSKGLGRMLFVIFITLSILFALGTFTSGTAVRHRYNVLPLLVISYAFCIPKNEKEELL